MPFVHMAIEGNGDLLPCCMGTPLDSANISGHTLNDMLTHPARTEMQTAFKENKQFENCAICWKDNSAFSPRVKFSTSSYSMDFTRSVMMGAVPENKMTWLEIKPGNRCNLKCRICGVHNSSGWAKDAYEMSGSSVPYKQSHIYDHMKKCEWIDQDQVWADVSGLEHVNTIHMMGGEPFMISEHYEFLQRFADAYDISKVTLWYNTNGTWTIPEKYSELFDSVGVVKLSVSIDDIAHRYDYQRPGVAWESVTQTVSQLFTLSEKKNYHVSLDPTVSIYNVLYLSEFIEFCNTAGWSFNYSPNHFVDNESYNNIRTLSSDQKEKIVATLSASKHVNHPLIQNTLRFITNDFWSQKMQDERVARIKQLDTIRNENFADVFPELNQILEIY